MGAGHCIADTAKQARGQVRQAIEADVDPVQMTHLHISVTLTAPRGAAQKPCHQGWKWGKIDASHWKRIHLPVQCGGEPGSWAAQVRVQAPLWHAQSDLPAGQALQAQDFQQRTGVVYQTADLLSRDDWEHLHLQRNVPKGHVLRLRDLERPIYARKGDVVEIQATQDGITVSTQGLATQTARRGDTVRVRNVHSKHWVNGTMTGPKVMQASPERAGGVKVELESPD